MVGTELVKKLKTEINKYIGIPYWMNKLKDGKIVLEGVYGGKGNRKEIQKATLDFALKEKIDLSKLNKQQIYNFQKKHHIGIDCSGLAYHLLDFYHQLLSGASIVDKVIGTESKYGVRRVSVKMLTHPQNAILINSYSDIQTADLIRLDKGNHILFIVKKDGNTIHYVHSSDKTKNRGVHYGFITITDPALPLNLQEWSDHTLDNQNYQSLFFPKDGDGIFRLKCLN